MLGRNNWAENKGVRKEILTKSYKSSEQRESEGHWERFPGGGSVYECLQGGWSLKARELGGWKTPQAERMVGANPWSWKLKGFFWAERSLFSMSRSECFKTFKAVFWNECHFSVFFFFLQNIIFLRPGTTLSHPFRILTLSLGLGFQMKVCWVNLNEQPMMGTEICCQIVEGPERQAECFEGNALNLATSADAPALFSGTSCSF